MKFTEKQLRHFAESAAGEKEAASEETHCADEKNAATDHNYKRMVRIIEKMRCLMEEQGCASAREVSFFELESLLWNLPNELFMRHCFYRYLFDDIVEYLYRNDERMAGYKELDGVKPLCPQYTDRNRINGFIYELRQFYEYCLTED
ncbi:MAG: hypothetical protein NC432_10995 [Roseburia sp.]|nr:hypothetical protein [Roseburia sp.]MCM1099239.1 hypothetical protein [Ruminococcus flavefaciens]